MSLFSMFFFISLYLQQMLHYDALKAGFAYLPLAVDDHHLGGVGFADGHRVGFKPTLITGMLFDHRGLLLVLAGQRAGRQLPRRRAVPVAARRRRPRLRLRLGHDRRGGGHEARDAGLASGLINTTQQVGGALGLAILAAVANAATDNSQCRQSPGRAERRLPHRVPRRRGLRAGRRDPRLRADRQPRLARGGRGRHPRRGPGSRRGLTPLRLGYRTRG